MIYMLLLNMVSLVDIKNDSWDYHLYTGGGHICRALRLGYFSALQQSVVPYLNLEYLRKQESAFHTATIRPRSVFPRSEEMVGSSIA